MKQFCQLLLLTLLILVAAETQAKQYDLIIKNGFVIDGSRTVGKKENIAIRDGKIVYVGLNANLSAKKVIDVKGLTVSPGFIDVHNHAESIVDSGASLRNESYLLQGVTTLVTGPDGYLAPKDIIAIKRYLKQNGSSTNVAVYIGHNGVRQQVMGMKPVLASSEQLEAMKKLVKQGMKLGAVGLSTGLMYQPGMYSNTEEVIELAKVAAAFGGSYDSHVRDPVHELIKSYKEVIEIGREAHIPVKIAHAKLVGLDNSDLFPQVRKLINHARDKGIYVVSDQYPYDGAFNEWIWQAIALPEAMQPANKRDYNRELISNLLKDPAKRAELKKYNETNKDKFTWIKAVGYKSMRIVVSKERPNLVGKHISELASEWSESAFDVMSELIINPELNVNITYGSVLERNVQNFLMQPWNMISSDGAWSSDSKTMLKTHPRSTGTYPGILGRYVRETGLLDLSEAIYKMSAFPAKFLGLGKRGLIKEGYIADITIFDANTIIDRSTWVHPERLSVGVKYVLVNGKFAVADGKMTAKMTGQFVRHVSVEK